MSQFTAILTSMFVGAGRGRVWVWKAASAGWPGPLAWLLASDRHCHGMGFSRVYEAVLKEGLWEGVCGGLPPWPWLQAGPHQLLLLQLVWACLQPQPPKAHTSCYCCRPWVAVACGLYSTAGVVGGCVQVFRDSFN